MKKYLSIFALFFAFGIIIAMANVIYQQRDMIKSLQSVSCELPVNSLPAASMPTMDQIPMTNQMSAPGISIPIGSSVPFMNKVYGKIFSISADKLSINAEIYDFSEQKGIPDALTAPIKIKYYEVVISSTTAFYKKGVNDYKPGDQVIVVVDGNIYDIDRKFTAEKISFVDKIPIGIRPQDMDIMPSEAMMK